MHKTQATPTVTVQPLYLNRQDAAAYLSISVSQLEAMSSRGEIPAPRQISSGRSGWLVSELQEWGLSRPPSALLPPKNSGYGRAGASTAKEASKPSSLPSQ